MKLPLFLTAALLAATTASAHDYKIGDITIAHPFSFATVGNAPVGGGYMEITNTGETDDTLIAVTVAEDVAGTVQLHQMAMDDGVMRMSQVEGGIAVPAGETVVLQSGGLHVMFMRLPDGLQEGESFPATLTFAQAGEVEVVFKVETRGEAERAEDHSGHGDADHSDGNHGGDHSGHGN